MGPSSADGSGVPASRGGEPLPAGGVRVACLVMAHHHRSTRPTLGARALASRPTLVPMAADGALHEFAVTHALRDDFPELRAWCVWLDVSSRVSQRSMSGRLADLDDRNRTAPVGGFRTHPLTAAYRSFVRQIGLDPDVDRTPLDEATPGGCRSAVTDPADESPTRRSSPCSRRASRYGCSTPTRLRGGRG